MVTKSIADRTQEYQTKFSDIKTPHDQFLIGKAYYEGATEQDTIARMEERERCTKIAQKWICDNCAHWQHGQFEYCSACPAQKQIQKAMEGDKQ